MKIFKPSENSSLFAYFIIVSLIGSILLSMPFAYKDGISVDYIDALFTAVSAVCVTGLSTLSMDIYSRAGFVILLLLIELGGLGILSFVALYLAVPFKKVSMVNRKLIRDFFIDDVDYKPRRILYKILGTTIGIQLLGWLLLLPAMYKYGSESYIFDSLFLSVSAFCNAGFSPKADSLAAFGNNPYILSVIMFLIVIGGIGFVVISDIGNRIKALVKNSNHYLSVHTKIVLLFTAILIVSGAAVTFGLCFNSGLKDLPLKDKIFLSFFESITLRTAGFEVIPQSEFTPGATFFHLALMFTGGSPGSIAGGVKTTTVFIALVYAFGGDENQNILTLFKRTIPSNTINKAITIVSRSFIFLALSVFFLAIAEHTNLMQGTINSLDLIYESTSAFATVGLTRGITPVLSTAGKLVIILTMFIGRTGIFAMALKLGRPAVNTEIIKYPADNVMVG
ncbi:MAG: hypothetical protein MJ162_04075 [Treponema sp.]|nr:hypothetical protein [Treponema sp.]